MFTLEVAIKADKIPAEKREALFAAHGDWIQANYDQGTFLLMGPYTTKDMTGLIIGQVEELAELDAIIQADAFYPDYADYSVNEFTINKINPAIADVK